MKPAKEISLSIEEYLKLELDTQQRYEYHNGEVYALAGGSIAHTLLVGNIYTELRNGLKKSAKPCKALTSEAKLHIALGNKFVYPDSMVVCGEMQVSENTKEAIVNPTLIVEVLSKSTAAYDRGDKFFFYRQIPTFTEYVLIEQDRHVVEVFTKKDIANSWEIARYEGLDKQVFLHALGISISMRDLYFDVEIEKPNS